jgi:SSS family solute:Na+ symporter
VIVQRVLSARDEGHAKAGTISPFLKILPVFMLVLPGIVAFALFPEQMKAKPDSAYPTLVLSLLPVGLVGLVMAARCWPL